MLLTMNGQQSVLKVRTESLEALLEDVRASCPADELIVSIAWNGQPLDQEGLQSRLHLPIDADVQIDLDTAPRHVTVADALRSAAADLQAAAEEQRSGAADLATGSTGEGMARIQELPALLQMCSQAIESSSELLGQNLLEVVIHGAPVAARLAELHEQLQQLRSALVARDMVSLGDLLQVELPQACETWAEALNHLADHATKIGAGR